jgi:hypothetical protein
VQDDTVKSADYCRARVEESERMAAKAKDPQNKAIFDDLANRWRRLAEESKSDALKPIGDSRTRRGDIDQFGKSGGVR